MSENKIVDEIVDILLSSNEKLEYHKFIDKITSLYNQNSHRAYSSFNVFLKKEDKVGFNLFLTGEREESKEERETREKVEDFKRRSVEEAELKEYLRLHKKYGKKE